MRLIIAAIMLALAIVTCQAGEGKNAKESPASFFGLQIGMTLAQVDSVASAIGLQWEYGKPESWRDALISLVVPDTAAHHLALRTHLLLLNFRDAKLAQITMESDWCHVNRGTECSELIFEFAEDARAVFAALRGEPTTTFALDADYLFEKGSYVRYYWEPRGRAKMACVIAYHYSQTTGDLYALAIYGREL